MNRCKRFLVRGRVQGVFFRTSTRDAARRLGLCGFAKNLPDGRVEVVACGSDDSLKRLEAWLWQGPTYAHVDEVMVQEATPRTLADFEIR
ncbi:MAG: acylphosphatase [Acidiferrobacterales bacterium]